MAGRGWRVAATQGVLVVRWGRRRPSGASRRAQTACEAATRDISAGRQRLAADVDRTHLLLSRVG
ncbi:MAG: hypothetical protein WA708_05145, partial [Acidobacteriaceae bacterium]